MRSLRFHPPLAATGLLGFLGARAIPGVEEVDGPRYRRSVCSAGGPAVLTLRIERDRVFGPTDGVLRRIARTVFDLDARPSEIAEALARDRVLRPLVRRNAGVRVPGAADGFELVVRAVLGQQVSVAAARTMLGRVAARFGTPLAIDGAIDTTFPMPDRLADAPLEALGITRRRAATIRRVAALLAAGDLDLAPGGDLDATAARLLEIDGIGPWTVEVVRMRALGDRDAFPVRDLGIRRAAERLGLDPAPGALLARAEAWRPYRAYAAMLLWSALGLATVTPVDA